MLGWVVYAQIDGLWPTSSALQGRHRLQNRSRSAAARPGAFDKAAEAIEDVHRAVSSDEPATRSRARPPTKPIGAMLQRRPTRSARRGSRWRDGWTVRIHVRETAHRSRLSPSQLLGTYVDRRCVGPLGTAGPRDRLRHLHAAPARGPARPADPAGRPRAAHTSRRRRSTTPPRASAATCWRRRS